MLRLADRLIQVNVLLSAESRSQRHIVQGIFRAGALGFQGFVKAFSQLGKEGQGAAQIYDISLDLPSLCQTGDSLVDHSVKNTGGDIILPGTLVQQGLDIRFGEHTAPGSDGIGFLIGFGKLVHLVGSYVQQGGHLIDESAGTSGAGAVHPHLHTAGQKQDFGILPA